MRRRHAASCAVVLFVLAAAPLGAGPARAVAPASLAVYFAAGSASPVGIITRVPAESDGGLVFSSSSVRLGKAQAEAAGATTGPLGDAFVVTSAPAGTLTSIPSVVNAQDPPSQDAPREGRFSGGQEAGPVRGVVLHAVASDAPRARSESTGSSIDAVVVQTGAATSRSESKVLADGTVLSTAASTVQDVSIAAGGAPALTIGSLTSEASVTVAPGRKPVTVLRVQAAGSQLAGVPVDITQDGIRVAGTIAVPASSLAAVNAALAMLGDRGLAISVVPTVRQIGDGGATVSGAALQVRYQVPDTSVPRPTDIGADETFLLGSVSASATARPREPLVLGLPRVSLPAGSPPPPGRPATASARNAVALPVSGAPAAPPAPGPAVAGPVPAQAPAGFSLPARVSNAAAEQLLASYRMFLVSAAVGLGGLLVARRARRLA